MIRTLTSAIAICLAPPVAAQGIDDVFDLSVRTGWRQSDGTHIAGLDVRLAPGWKTYWRQPGDAGIPPVFDWSASANLSDVQVLYPEPKVTWADGFRSIGYADRVIFPLQITSDDAGPIMLGGVVQLGICEEICIPVQVRVMAELPATGGNDLSLKQAMDQQITAGKGHVACSFSPVDDAMALTLHVPKSGGSAPELAVEYPQPKLWIAQPTVTDGGDYWIATTTILSPSGKPTALERSSVRITSFSTKGAVEYMGCKGS
ncbi:MAG: protein-disulfide reductase DsbD domain-containing protein [Planktomarina sp.]